MAWLTAVAGFLIMILVGLSTQNSHRTRALYDSAYAVDTARNFGVLASKAATLYAANPTYSGVLPQGALGLPTWYTPLPGLTAFANGGHLLVYQPQASAAIGGRVLKQLAATGQIVGMCLNGTIYSPANVALMAAPVGVPNYAVVQIVL